MEKLYSIRQINDLKDLMTQSRRLYGDKTAFLVKGKNDDYHPVSYEEFSDDVDALGTALINIGIKDCAVAVLGENRYEWCASYLSIVNGNGIVVPLDKELPQNEIKNLLERSEASAVIFSGKYRECIKNLKPELSKVSVYIDMDLEMNEDGILSYQQMRKAGRELIKSGDKSFVTAEVEPDAAKMLIFTSGTTEMAKGVMLSHRNICSNIMAVCGTVYVGSDDRSLSILPLHHTYECTLGFLTFIYNGGTISFNNGLRNIAKNLKSIKPTIMITVPLLLENIYNKIQDKLRKSKADKFKFYIALYFTNLLNKLFKIDLRRKVFKLSLIHI